MYSSYSQVDGGRMGGKMSNEMRLKKFFASSVCVCVFIVGGASPQSKWSDFSDVFLGQSDGKDLSIRRCFVEQCFVNGAYVRGNVSLATTTTAGRCSPFPFNTQQVCDKFTLHRVKKEIEYLDLAGVSSSRRNS